MKYLMTLTIVKSETIVSEDLTFDEMQDQIIDWLSSGMVKEGDIVQIEVIK